MKNSKIDVELYDKYDLRSILENPEKDISHYYMDIDNFGVFNLHNGYEKGNVVLETIKNIIAQKTFIQNWLHLESDEFIFSCNGNFDAVKNNLFSLMEELDKQLNVTVSIAGTEMLGTSEILMNKLRCNLIQGKINGKNNIYIH